MIDAKADTIPERGGGWVDRRT